MNANTRIPEKLILLLKYEFNLKYFIETGTFLGGTASWASQYFESVFTIENSKELWQKASADYADINNIKFIMGDSRLKLQEIVDKIESAALFWLDAHWSGGITYGEGKECPLLEELQTIVDHSKDDFILVDDARLFLAPPPKPHAPDQWPDIVSIINVLTSKQPRFVAVINDVIVAVPIIAKGLVIKYCQDINTDIKQDNKSRKPSIPYILGKFLRKK